MNGDLAMRAGVRRAATRTQALGGSGWAAILLLSVLLGLGGVCEAQAPPQEETDDRFQDCRYEVVAPKESAQATAGKTVGFPTGDVFRPLFADPKQPQFFASYQAVTRREPAAPIRDVGRSVNVGSVGFGENFGLVGKRRGCNGWQVGILAGVFSQFNLDSSSSDLLNTDFVFGIPLTVRQGLWSARVRLYHQSSHLGDELVLGNPGFNRVNLSFEEVEAIGSLDAPGGWGRVYAGGGYLIHRTPDLHRNRVQWGAEFRGPSWHSVLFQRWLDRPFIATPVFGADFKVFEQLGWVVNTNLLGGIEWVRPDIQRRFRLLLNYYRGFNQYGQFFSQKIESVGVGLYLAF